MLDAATAEEIGRLLDASGVYLYRRTSSDGANYDGTEVVPWVPALLKMMQLTGWGVAMQENEPESSSPVLYLDSSRRDDDYEDEA